MQNRRPRQASPGSGFGGLNVEAASTRRMPRSAIQARPACQIASSDRTAAIAGIRKRGKRFMASD